MTACPEFNFLSKLLIAVQLKDALDVLRAMGASDSGGRGQISFIYGNAP